MSNTNYHGKTYRDPWATPRVRRRRPGPSEIDQTICYAHGEVPKLICPGCLHWADVDRDEAALGGEF